MLATLCFASSSNQLVTQIYSKLAPNQKNQFDISRWQLALSFMAVPEYQSDVAEISKRLNQEDAIVLMMQDELDTSGAELLKISCQKPKFTLNALLGDSRTTLTTFECLIGTPYVSSGPKDSTSVEQLTRLYMQSVNHVYKDSIYSVTPSMLENKYSCQVIPSVRGYRSNTGLNLEFHKNQMLPSRILDWCPLPYSDNFDANINSVNLDLLVSNFVYNKLGYSSFWFVDNGPICGLSFIPDDESDMYSILPAIREARILDTVLPGHTLLWREYNVTLTNAESKQQVFMIAASAEFGLILSCTPLSGGLRNIGVAQLGEKPNLSYKTDVTWLGSTIRGQLVPQGAKKEGQTQWLWLKQGGATFRCEYEQRSGAIWFESQSFRPSGALKSALAEAFPPRN